jgi:hypothetical protein
VREEGAKDRRGGTAAFGLVVVGVLGEGFEGLSGDVGGFGEADGDVVGDGASGGADVGADLGRGVMVEEVGEVEAGGVGHLDEGGAAGEDGGDDVGLLRREGREVGEFVEHGCRLEVRRGDARWFGRMLRKLRADVTEGGRKWQSDRVTK